MAEPIPDLQRKRPSLATFTGWTILFMVVLRILIGWHFFYEGAWKLSQDDWTADGYLLASSGPLRPLFVEMVPDANGFERLTRESILKRMDRRAKVAVEHFQLDDRQKQIFLDFVERKKHGIQDDNNVRSLFADPAFQKQLAEYRVAIIEKKNPDPGPIIDRVEAIFDDMDATIVDHFRQTVRTFAEGLGPDDAADRAVILEALEARGDLPARASIVPKDTPKPDDLSWLTPDYVNARLQDRYMGQIRPFYYEFAPKGISSEQVRAELANALFDLHQSAYGWRYRDQKMIGGDRDRNNVDAIWDDVDFQEALVNYRNLYEQTVAEEDLERTAPGGEFNQERMLYDYGKKNAARRELLARLETPFNDLDPAKMDNFNEKFGMHLTEAQLGLGPLPKESKPLLSNFVNWGNMLGLTLVGLCLMLGLFTRLAALGGIALLALYYFAMPPWPGLPESPMAEGHYLIVNKNLIEAAALLMIATTRIGRWAGLDAYIAPLLARRAGKAPAPASG